MTPPSQLSRLVLVDMKYLMNKGVRLTNTVYRKPDAFLIKDSREETKDYPCCEKHKGDKERRYKTLHRVQV